MLVAQGEESLEAIRILGFEIPGDVQDQIALGRTVEVDEEADHPVLLI